jgi:hypothetical protein
VNDFAQSITGSPRDLEAVDERVKKYMQGFSSEDVMRHLGEIDRIKDRWARESTDIERRHEQGSQDIYTYLIAQPGMSELYREMQSAIPAS